MCGAKSLCTQHTACDLLRLPYRAVLWIGTLYTLECQCFPTWECRTCSTWVRKSGISYTSQHYGVVPIDHPVGCFIDRIILMASGFNDHGVFRVSFFHSYCHTREDVCSQELQRSLILTKRCIFQVMKRHCDATVLFTQMVTLWPQLAVFEKELESGRCHAWFDKPTGASSVETRSIRGNQCELCHRQKMKKSITACSFVFQ